MVQHGARAKETSGPLVSNVNRPPTAEEIARDEATAEPRTVAIGSTPEGARNPLWSAEEFNGTWFSYCFPAVCAISKLTNVGDDVVKQESVVIPCFITDSSEVAWIGNSNRFWSTSYVAQTGKRSQEVVTFTSTTFRTHGCQPSFGCKICK